MRSMTDLEALRDRHLGSVLDLWRAAGKRTVIAVRGGSMLPFLRPGQDVVLDHSAARHPLGAVIVFFQGKMLVVHRVVGGGRRGYLTKGDAILHFDRGPVSPDNVVGRVIAVCQDRREWAFATRGGVRAVAIAVLSRMVGELNRICRVLRWLSSPAGRLVGVVPGPTRILRAVNRGLMRGASRAVGRAGADETVEPD